VQIDPEKAINYVIEQSPKFAEAKANRRYLEEYKKTLLAQLFQEAPSGTVADREAWARAHKSYQLVLEGLKDAVKVESELEWRMKAALTKVEVWRSLEASHRFIDQVTK